MKAYGMMAATILLTACGQQVDPAARDATIRLPAVPGRPGAAYFTLTGAAGPLTLTAATTPAAQRTELHESMAHGGTMSMQPIANIALPAGGTLAFQPGGKHVMLFGIRPDVKPGDTVPLTLGFAGGRTLTTQARVVGAGD